jgi:hypothetical protein
MKNLATIQKIQWVKPIEGADAIELVGVLGWQVVVRKNEYKVGDLCCYIQIDTVVPNKPEFEFLEAKKFRVRTIKLCRELSQGLIIPVPNNPTGLYYWNEGDDVTDVIGVKKYEKPDNNPVDIKPKAPKVWYKKWIYLFKYNYLYKWFPKLKRKTRSNFPKDLVSITDEERIQNIPWVLEKYKGQKFTVSYKLDGSSITIIHNKVFGRSKFRICSRRFELHDTNNDWYKVFKSTDFEKHILKLVDYYKTDNIIVQGEAIGKFNGNYHNLKQDEIRLFNIFVDGKKIQQFDLIWVCNNLNIPYCPFFKTITLNHNMDEILKISEIPDILNSKVPVEGLVWRCHNDLLSFKVINNQYLLKEK